MSENGVAASVLVMTDCNSGWTQYAIKNSRRASSATAFLEPALNRPNLDVLIHSTVTRLVQSGRRNGKPQFKTVEFATGPSGMSCFLAIYHGFLTIHLRLENRYTITARKEVVLSAGATNTPQILLLSGLGPASHLTSLGIKPILNLPAVGSNLIDHTITCPSFSVNYTTTFDDFQRNATLAAETFAQWNTTGQGQFSVGIANQIAWLKVPKNESVWNEVKSDPSAGKTAGNYEFLFAVC